MYLAFIFCYFLGYFYWGFISHSKIETFQNFLPTSYNYPGILTSLYIDMFVFVLLRKYPE